MTKNAKIGAALVGGYLLGRTKKAKLALGFGMFLLGKKMDLDPRQLGRMLADSPVLGSLNDQVRKELVDATKTAATKALTQRAGSLADSLQQRTQALGAGSAAEDEETGEDEEPKKDARADRDEDTGGSGKRKRAPRKTASSESSSRSGSSSGAGRSGSGSKSAAPARKRGSAARKTASSGARKARGGDDA
ncbi:hypothetical protein ACH4A3_27670 [Streptomyces sp. NPDC018007]|uniref:hypothetical protein n=1 Tax=Streptomyces sp. NPDC018007 TaxID=3365029 RepID=UPI0037B714C8